MQSWPSACRRRHGATKAARADTSLYEYMSRQKTASWDGARTGSCSRLASCARRSVCVHVSVGESRQMRLSKHSPQWCMCQWVSQDRSLEQALTPMQEESELEVLPPPQRRYGGARCSHPRSLCRRWSRCHERARPTIPSGRGWHTSPIVVCSCLTISQRRFTIARPPVPRCKRHSNESERYSNHQQPAAPHSQLQRHGSCLKMLSRKRPCSFSKLC
jgi:hypothetical protein